MSGDEHRKPSISIPQVTDAELAARPLMRVSRELAQKIARAEVGTCDVLGISETEVLAGAVVDSIAAARIAAFFEHVLTVEKQNAASKRLRTDYPEYGAWLASLSGLQHSSDAAAALRVRVMRERRDRGMAILVNDARVRLRDSYLDAAEHHKMLLLAGELGLSPDDVENAYQIASEGRAFQRERAPEAASRVASVAPSPATTRKRPITERLPGERVASGGDARPAGPLAGFAAAVPQDGARPGSADGRDVYGLVGTRVDGKVLIESVVDEGGFGVVYRGVHEIFKRPVALKCLKVPAQLADADREAFLERFQEEARMQLDLASKSSAIVRVLDIGTLHSARGERVPYMLLEWLEGCSLEDLISRLAAAGRIPLPLIDVISLLDGAASGLSAAHRQRIVHRDVKPANFFVVEPDGDRTTKVLDFGIAKVLRADDDPTGAVTRTPEALFAFTPAYGAPEQFDRKRYGASGPWTDVFALALIASEMLTGRGALEGESAAEHFLSASRPDVRPTPRARGVWVDDTVEAVFQRALAVHPGERYADVAQFWAELRGAAGLEPVAWAADRGSMLPSSRDFTPPPSFAGLPPPRSSGGRTTAPVIGMPLPPPATQRPRSSRLGMVAAAVGVLCIGGVAVAVRNTSDASSEALGAPPRPTASARPTVSAAAAPACAHAVGDKVTVTREPTHAEWDACKGLARMPQSVGITYTVDTVSGGCFAPKHPSYFLPCQVAEKRAQNR